MMVAYNTAHYALVDVGRVKAGEWQREGGGGRQCAGAMHDRHLWSGSAYPSSHQCLSNQPSRLSEVRTSGKRLVI